MNRRHYEYQDHFYSQCEGVRDPEIRKSKAQKIAKLLVRYTPFCLSSAVCLDVGCSSGIITAEVASLCKLTLGVDYDEVGLNAVESDVRATAHFLRGDAMGLPFRENSMDVIVCAQVYEHVPDADVLFEELYRLLKPGGVIFFSGPNWLFPIEPHYFLPFLHWLPARAADLYLRVTRRGSHYYERSCTIGALRRKLNRFVIRDVSSDVVVSAVSAKCNALGWILKHLPDLFWKSICLFLPNFNWILFKSEEC
jgi:2-polyprenyl-3-methyl-5-hydroxy-6-metoxy-1,4-benzoquinol methylase